MLNIEHLRKQAKLYLRWHREHYYPVAARIRAVLPRSITLEHAKPLFIEYQEAGVEFVQPLRTEPWRARTFIVSDPDGNLPLFAGRDE